MARGWGEEIWRKLIWLWELMFLCPRSNGVVVLATMLDIKIDKGMSRRAIVFGPPYLEHVSGAYGRER
jgi:hypothetical protein